MDYSFPKSERLCHKKIFGDLVSEGKGFMAHPVRWVWMKTELPADVPVQVAFSVSKRRFKKAVDRNRIKRQLREAWRLSKPDITAIAEGQQYAILLVYIAQEHPTASQLEKSMQKGMAKWKDQLSETP